MTKQASSTKKTETVSAATESVATTTPVVKVAKAAKPAAKVEAASAPTVETVAKKTVSAKKTSAPKEAAAAVAVPVAAATQSENQVLATSEVPTLPGDFTDFMSKLQQVSSLISSLKSEFRSLEKKASRELKSANKAGARRKRKTGNRSPSGFVKPTLISNELAVFLGKTQGTEMARTEVTREINAYIRTNKLQDTQNGRKINADKKLKTLLKLNEGDELTYFNLQRYMSPHFAKTSSVSAAVVEVAA
jgi:chromatin remodeling complex protein RSC6